jgi:hypothetical protein
VRRLISNFSIGKLPEGGSLSLRSKITIISLLKLRKLPLERYSSIQEGLRAQLFLKSILLIKKISIKLKVGLANLEISSKDKWLKNHKRRQRIKRYLIFRATSLKKRIRTTCNQVNKPTRTQEN